MRVLLAITALLAADGASAASLRSATTLHGPLVFVRDLFDDAGASADRVLGPGPAPGDRIIVEAPQLNAIARQFGVAWRSVSSADRAVLEWPGRTLRQEEVMEAVRIALAAAGAPDDSEIDLLGFATPVVPAEADVALAVAQMDYDTATGRFTASLSVTADNMNAMNLRVSGRIEAMTEAPVTVTRMLAETVIRAEDIRVARIRAAQLPNEAAVSLQQIIGMQLRRPVPAGQPLRLADLMRPPLVQRGAIVQVELTANGLTVTGPATAMEDGAEGERIVVQNGSSKAYLYADVIGPGKVRIVPGSPAATTALPVRANRRVRTP